MVEPTSQDLYVMQNEFGLIKIGRSVDVEQRRATLQSTERCKIAIVEVYTGCGDMEEDIHLDMDDHRLAGEWFDGSDDARAALAELVELSDPPVKWPYAYNRKGAAAWLDHINVVRHAATIRKSLYREITILRDAPGPSWVYDVSVFYVIALAATGERPELYPVKIDGRVHRRWVDRHRGTSGIVPDYTASVENALLAWPDELRPASWTGSAIECCIAALTAIREGLPRVDRIRPDRA